MVKEKMTGGQMVCIIAMFYAGSAVFSNITTSVQQDFWLCLLIATAAVVPLILLYTAILRLYPGKNLYEIMVLVFGTVIGKILCVLYAFNAILSGAIAVNFFSELVHMMNMQETPRLFFICAISLVTLYIVYKGFINMGRFSKFLLPLVLVIAGVIVLAGTKVMDVDNLRPVLATGTGELLDASFTAFSRPAAEILAFTTLMSFVNLQHSAKKIYFFGVFLGMGIVLISFLRNILILGSTISLFYFPSYQATSIIAVGDFFSRIEVLLGVNLLILGLVRFATYVFSASVGLALVLNVHDDKYMAAPVLLIIVTLCGFLFRNLTQALEFIRYYRFYLIPFQILIPLALWIGGLIRKRTSDLKPVHSEENETPEF